MKCFVIVRPDGTYNAKNSWQALHPAAGKHSVTDDLEKAKHYKTRGGLTRIVTMRRNELTRDLQFCSERLADVNDDNVTDSEFQVKYDYWRGVVKEDCRSSLERDVKDYNKRLEFLDQIEVTEVEVEYPSFTVNPMPEYKFSIDGGFGKANRGGMFCKCCGIEIKGVGAYKFGKKGSATAKVCLLCMSEKGAQATAELEAMDPELRKHIESERFLNKL